jgi:hypothetical protein
MRGPQWYLATTILSAAVIFSSAADAMPIPQYEKMAQADRTDYSVALVEGAIKALNAHGQPEQAQKLSALFVDKSDKGGFHQLAKNLEVFKAINRENAANPNNKEPIYEVEHAFGVTLKDNGIIVPVSVLLAINKDFKPGQSSGKAAPK